MSAQGQTLPDDRRAATQPDDPNSESVGDYTQIDGGEDTNSYSTEVAPDGSLIVTIGEPYEAPQQDGGFYDNLADGIISESVLGKISTNLLRLIDDDKQAREKADKLYEEGIRRTGLGKDAPGGADFEGASRVVHPMLTEVCIEYESRIIKELWPVAGPVREKIVGVVTREKDERAKRKTEFLNFQMVTQMKEARATFESMLTQVPLGGRQYIKLWQDHRLKRPRVQFVPCDDTYLPAAAADWYSAHRRTIRDKMPWTELQTRIASGMYRDIDIPKISMEPEESKAAAATQKVIGKEPTGMNVDGDREIYEVMSYLEVDTDMADALGYEQEGELCPYLITIDVSSRKVLSFYRDWEMDDDTFEPIDHLFEFPFIPWRGSSIGLAQIIGGLSGAATGALRALLDSAHIANVQGGFILKGSGTGAQTRRAQPGDFAEIDGGGLETQDIRAKVMQFNTKEPSNVLFQLLGFLVDAGKGTVRTSLDDDMVNSNSNTPVGTQIIRTEDGLMVFSSIHGRVHMAMNRFLEGLCRLNRMYLDETVRVDAQGAEIMVRRADFDGPPDVQAVSDPQIYSDMQRMTQVMAMQQRAALVPGLYDNREVEEYFLELIKVPDPDRFLTPQPKPHELNAVNENVSMALGRPVTAFPEQDHMAHLATHLDFLVSPVLGANPLIQPKFLPAVLQHVTEHIVLEYASMTNNLVSGAAGRRASDLMSADVTVKAKFDGLLAVASGIVVMKAQQDFANMMPPLQQALQTFKAMQPPPPVDPAQAALQSSQAETARRAQNDQATNQLKQQDNAAKDRNDQVRNAIAAERNTVTQQDANLTAQTALTRTAMETQTARDIAETKIASGGATNLSDGVSLGG